MQTLPMFLSVVYVVKNQAADLEEIVRHAIGSLDAMVNDYELIIVDNGSDDDSISILRNLALIEQIPNLQVYALTKEVGTDIASWAGLENALGDFVAVVDPLADDISYLSVMLDKASSGADVVFAKNLITVKSAQTYRFASYMFNRLYKMFNGVDLAKDAPQFRVLSKRVINFILQHPQPAIMYRHLPATGGFVRVNLTYSGNEHTQNHKRLWESVDRGVRLLVSTTQAPMRLVTLISMFGAISNLLYSFYVVAVGMLKEDVAPGWLSLSLQQSGMFFLISIVLFVLGEYILHMAGLSNEGPMYHVGQEFTSTRIGHQNKLNIEEVEASNTVSAFTVD